MNRAASPHESLVTRVAHQLCESIEAGEYAIGSRIPTEPRLMEQFGVSRSTVREAVRILADCGMLEIKQGSGTYCRSLRPLPTFPSGRLNNDSLSTVYEVRRIFEVGIVRLASKKRTEADIAIMKKALSDRKSSMERLDFDAYTAADLVFHNQLAKSAHNSILEDLFKGYSKLLESVLHEDESRNGFDENVQFTHEKVLESVAQGDAEKAAAFMSDIIDNDLKWIEGAKRSSKEPA